MTEHDGCTGCRHFEKYRHIANTTSEMPCYDCEMAHSQNVLKDKYEPMTNADRIRNMSDAQLSEFICGMFGLGRHSKIPFKHNLEWLQSEVMESETE